MPNDGRQESRSGYGKKGDRPGSGYSNPRPASASVETAVYHDDKGKLDPRWVDSEAEHVAKCLGDEKLKPAQLRKFYSEVKTLERIWITRDRTDEAFADLLPQIKILKAKAVYAKERSVAGDYFQRWLTAHVNAVKNPKDFAAFLLHFEAVVGFSKQYLKD